MLEHKNTFACIAIKSSNNGVNTSELLRLFREYFQPELHEMADSHIEVWWDWEEREARELALLLMHEITK